MPIHFMYYPFRYPSMRRDGRAIPPYPLDAILPLALYPLLVYATMPKWGAMPADPPPSYGGKPPLPPYGAPSGMPGLPPYGGAPFGGGPFGSSPFGGSPYPPAGAQPSPGIPSLFPFAGNPGGATPGGNPLLSSLFGAGSVPPQNSAGAMGSGGAPILPPFSW